MSPGLVYPPPKPGLAFAIPTKEQSQQNLAKAIALPAPVLKKEQPLLQVGKEPTRVPAPILKKPGGLLAEGGGKLPVAVGPFVTRKSKNKLPNYEQLFPGTM